MKEGVTLTAVNPLAAWDRFSGETLLFKFGLFLSLGSPVSYSLQGLSHSGSQATEERMISDISMQSGSQRTIDDDGLVDIDEKRAMMSQKF